MRAPATPVPMSWSSEHVEVSTATTDQIPTDLS